MQADIRETSSFQFRPSQWGNGETFARKESAAQSTLIDGQIGIRRFRQDDVPHHFNSVRESISELSSWMVWCHPNFALEDSAAFVSLSEPKWEQRERYSFVIFDVNEGSFLGSVGLSGINQMHKVANLGYWVRSSRTGRGIAAKATRLIAQFAFEELRLNRLELLVPVKNRPSQRVAERTGAKVEGVLRSRLMLNNESHDALLYSLVAEDLARR